MSGLRDAFDDIEREYGTEEILARSWSVERERVQECLNELAAKVDNRYSYTDVLGVGGGGIVLKVLDSDAQRHRALKFPRPVIGREDLVARVLVDETERLHAVRHRNVIAIHSFHRGDEECATPFYTMDYLEDMTTSADFVRSRATESALLEVMGGTIEAIAHLHAQSPDPIVHLDVKPENVLVSSDGEALLTDFGFAKRVRTDDGRTIAGGTEGYMHPRFVTWIVESEEDNRQIAEVPRSVIDVKWDLYALGKTVFRLLDALDEGDDMALRPYTRRYLRLMAARLLDGHIGSDEAALGLTKASLAELAYQSSGDVLLDFEKLIGSYSLEERVPELNPHIERIVQVSPAHPVAFTPRVARLLDCSEVRKLGGFAQLGLLSLVYPTASHTRLEHVLGSFAVACEYIRALYYDPVNPLFRQVMTERDLARGLLMALLHDVGHYPLAHEMEEVDKELFSHEARGEKILEESRGLRSVLSDPKTADGWEVSVEELVRALRTDPGRPDGSLKDRILKSIIDGPIDADKVDYLTRDSESLGVPYGCGVDAARLVRSVTVVFDETGTSVFARIGIHEKGIIPAESLLFARYALYGSAYWHHAHRAIKAMLARLVARSLETYKRGDERAKAGYRKRLKDELREYLEGMPTSQGSFSLIETLAGSTRAGLVATAAESALVEWLGSREGAPADLVADLLSRRLYKRALVSSRDGMGTLVDWEGLEGIWFGRGDQAWQTRLEIAQLLQKEIVGAVSKAPGPHTALSGMEVDSGDRFVDAAQRNPNLVLLDYPEWKTGSSEELKVLREDAHVRGKESADFRIEAVSEGGLVRELRRGVGLQKLRVFVHPGHARTVRAYLNRERLEQALNNAVGAYRAQH